jgi:hypothetical protein
LQWKEFLPFLVFFVILMSLLKWRPQYPWIIVVAALGMMYGVIMEKAVANESATPEMLKNIYPKMSTDI